MLKNPNLGNLRNDIKSGKYDVNAVHHNEPSTAFKNSRSPTGMGFGPRPGAGNSRPPINNNFSSKLKLGLGIAGGAGAMGGAMHLFGNDEHKPEIGELGSHYHNAFSNLSGVHENDAGGSAAVSTEAIASTGGSSFPMLKDKSPLDTINFKERLKNLKLRRV